MIAPVGRRPGWGSCVVAATGPSLTEAVAAQCRGQRVIAVNDAYRRLPFADVLYAGDADWWAVHQGCPDFAGEKWGTIGRRAPAPPWARAYGVQLVAGTHDTDGFSTNPAWIGWGGNSGFAAINLALLFGATTIRLVGFDMRVTEPRHFFGDHPAPLHNVAKYEHFLGAFRAAARQLPPGVRIINCTPGSALTCFEIGTLEELAAA